MGLPHTYIFSTIIPSGSLASQTLSIPQHQSLLVSHTESIRHCGMKRDWLAETTLVQGQANLFLMHTLNGRVFAMTSLQKITAPNELRHT